MAKDKTATNVVVKTSGQLAKELELPEAITVQIDGQSIICSLREFSSGSKGYNANGKVLIGGKKFQVSGNMILVGSKPQV